MQLNHFAVHLKLTQYCQSTNFNYKKKKKNCINLTPCHSQEKNQVQNKGSTGDSFYHNVEHLCTFSSIGYMLSANKHI